jgi:large subunit ribosomal protein L18
MTDKYTARLRRGKRTRKNIQEAGKVRLAVHRTPQHIYAQIIAGDGASTLVAASTVEKELQKSLKSTGGVLAAEHIGAVIAERALKAGVTEVAFDRSGYLYHGRIKALAEAARKGGLKF